MNDIDFAALSLMDALDLAILVEEEAAERYQELAEQMQLHHTPEAAKFFRFMIVNETKHGDELMARRQQLFGEAPRNVDPSMLWEVEAPAYDEVRVFMTAREALGVALGAEQKAHRFFAEALGHVDDEDVKKLFEELKEEEIYHQELVNKELDKLPEDPKVKTEDFADEPVGH